MSGLSKFRAHWGSHFETHPLHGALTLLTSMVLVILLLLLLVPPVK